LLDSLLKRIKSIKMALAEPRRRQKWTLNPRGNLWADDTNKFGQKLMEKMGWEQGKGLGANSDGRTEHITMRHKDDSKGVGFQGHDDTWLEHQDDFQSVLAALNAEHGTGEKVEKAETEGSKSLEETSKQSRRRVHYQKFTRGKDLAKYSADDLGCILGTKSDKVGEKKKKKEKEQKLKQEAEEKEEVTEIGAEKKEHGLVVIQGGNYQDYFAKKMALLKEKGKSTFTPELSADVKTEASEESEEDLEPKMVGFSQGEAESKPEAANESKPELAAETLEEVKKEKKKKKKSKKEKPEEVETDEILNDEKPDKKRKKPEATEIAPEVKPEPEEKPEPEKKLEPEIGSETEDIPTEKRKKRKRDREERVAEDELKKPKKKKSKKHKKDKTSEQEEESGENVGETVNKVEEAVANAKDVVMAEGTVVKHKKNKKNKKEKDKVVEEEKKEVEEGAPPSKTKKTKSEDSQQDDEEESKADKRIGFVGSNLLAIAGYAHMF